MSRRHAGFTLLEVMVATLLTGVVALMAIASAQVTAESSAVIHGSLRTVGSDRAARQVLLDLLHNVRPPHLRGDTSLALAGDTLHLTAAGASPLDAEYDWRITIYPVDSGLALDARTLGRAPAAHTRLRLGQVTRWQVRILAPGARDWTDNWSPAPVLPAAVAVHLWTGGRPLGPPLVVRMSDASSAPAGSEFLTD